MHYDHILAPYFMEQDTPADNAKEWTSETGRLLFKALRNAIDELDMDKMEEVIQDMALYHYDSWQMDLFKQLRNAVEELDVDTCETILAAWEQEEVSYGNGT